MTTQNRKPGPRDVQEPDRRRRELQRHMQAGLLEVLRQRRRQDPRASSRRGAGSGAMQRRRVAAALARHDATDGGAAATHGWRLGLSIALLLFAAVPFFDGGIACGAGLVALFAGLLVLQVIAAPPRSWPGRG